MPTASTHAERDDEEPEIAIGELRDLVTSTYDTSGGALVGEHFGRYMIVGEVATGGMAEVFLGVHKGLEDFVKVVVIKRVLPQWSSSPEFVRMFIDEARIAARLDHPNIVRTYEFGEVDGQYFTTMEYLPGEDLTKTLNRLVQTKEQMPVHIAAGVVSQVCAGLHFAHQLTDTVGRPLGLVHRDVNPSNVVVTYGGEVKLIDFGVAKTTSNIKTQTGTIKGKLSYMSPEQILGRETDQRSDVFSTGVVLWELLAQRPLFTRATEAATLYAILNDPITPPSRVRSDVPYELDLIVMQALARSPGDRFASAEEMQEALEQFLEHQFPKYDARSLARMLEELFGADRARAKRSIAQTRSLSANISLVMKLRTDVRRNDLLATGSHPDEPPAPRSKLVPILAILMLLGIAAGVVYLVSATDPSSSSDPVAAEVAHASIKIESTPAGAAISIGGEPTGLTTPATISGITARDVAIRLELPGHAPITEQVMVPAGATLTKSYTFEAEARPRQRGAEGRDNSAKHRQDK